MSKINIRLAPRATKFGNIINQSLPNEQVPVLEPQLLPESTSAPASSLEVDVTMIVVVGLLLAFCYAIIQKFK